MTQVKVWEEDIVVERRESMWIYGCGCLGVECVCVCVLFVSEYAMATKQQ